MTSTVFSPIRRTLRVATLITMLGLAGPAAAITIDRPSPAARPLELPSKDPSRAVALPKRDDLLTIDWVDAKAGRIGIGGITYIVRTPPPKIVLESGDEVASIGYLRAGMHARIETVADGAGATRLVTIRVAA